MLRTLTAAAVDRGEALELQLRTDDGLTPIDMCRSWEAKRLLKSKGRRGYGAKAKRAPPPPPARRSTVAGPPLPARES